MTTLYEQDYGLWAEQMADLIAAGRFDELDIENLVEEVRDLSKRERDRLLSSMRLIVHHFLKWDNQPQRRSRSWQTTIQRERLNIQKYLLDSPSLKRYLTDEYLNQVYETGRLDAIGETGLDMPIDCTYTIEDILERNVNLT
ncbi:DUF29 domain-containing protein [Pseudanabaena sp. 'Roaring Creek']|uniref:DUF29 domain-containing protein n=1 Tax=Pseudanabaena sp. 'Roaring Creek' TaxID=1681830 RepID=UPI0006D78C9B|nr:DUF29 domain-containing protein [Pseudanabaena sp. 'Roaring Creek']